MQGAKYNEEGDDLYLYETKITDDVDINHESLIDPVIYDICNAYEAGVRVGRHEDPAGPCPYAAGSSQAQAWHLGLSKGRLRHAT